MFLGNYFTVLRNYIAWQKNDDLFSINYRTTESISGVPPIDANTGSGTCISVGLYAGAANDATVHVADVEFTGHKKWLIRNHLVASIKHTGEEIECCEYRDNIENTESDYRKLVHHCGCTSLLR